MNSALGNFTNTGERIDIEQTPEHGTADPTYKPMRVVANSAVTNDNNTSGLAPESFEVIRLKQSIIEQSVEIDRLRALIEDSAVIQTCFDMPPMWAAFSVDESNKLEIQKILWLVLAMIDNGCEFWQIKSRLIGE